MTFRRLALAAVVIFAAAALVPWAGLLDGTIGGDSSIYEQYGRQIVHGQIPYRDFFMEYPPGAIPAFALPAAAGYEHSLEALKLLMLGCTLGVLACVAFLLRRLPSDRRRTWLALGLVALAPALLGPVLTTHYDPWPALLTALALAALVSGRRTTGFAALGVAAAAKVYPVLLLPVAALYAHRRWGTRGAWRGIVAAAVAFWAVLLPFVVLGAGGVRYSLEYESRRPPQIESLGSALLLTASHLGLYAPHPTQSYGSVNLHGAVPSALAAISTALGLVAVVTVAALFARGPRDDESLVLASAATVAVAVVFGKVLSPQYTVWLVPLVPLVAGAAGAAATVLLGGALMLTQSLRVWPSLAGGASWAVLARDLLLVALAAVLVAALRRRPAAAPDASART